VAPTPAAEDLFSNPDSKEVDKKRKEKFHMKVSKGLFACKLARPDIHLAIAVLCKWVKSPTEDDWLKLKRLMRYLTGTKDDKLILHADNLNVIKWYVDASFAVHPDF
jgi:hypothetical protein